VAIELPFGRSFQSKSEANQEFRKESDKERLEEMERNEKEAESDERWRVMLFGLPHERRLLLILLLLILGGTSSYRAYRYKAERDEALRLRDKVKKRLDEIHEAWRDSLLDNSGLLSQIDQKPEIEEVVRRLYQSLSLKGQDELASEDGVPQVSTTSSVTTQSTPSSTPKKNFTL